MKEYKLYPKYGFGSPDFNKLTAIFYDLDLAWDFVAYQVRNTGNDYAIFSDGKEIEPEF